MNKYDAVLIGGSAAGLSAATVLTRALRTVLVIDTGEPRNAPAAHLHGFLSRDGMTPDALLAAGRDEVLSYGGEILQRRVANLARGTDNDSFVVHCDDGTVIETRTVLVATGLRDELPDIVGVREQWGIGVLHCPYCHGYEVRNTAIAVLGGDNRPFTMHQAQLIRQWSGDVTFFPNQIVLDDVERERLTARGIRIVEGDVAQVVAKDGRVSGIELADGRVESREIVFVGPSFTPNDELLTGLGCTVGENGWVTVDPAGGTSIPGVWAAGNVVDSPAQLITAAGAGSKAAIALNHYLLAQDVDRAVAETTIAFGSR
ncbi:NAD(P)/FAD-dependent oxidoreductase [Rhodococcus sp. IEGM 1379]|uniref:NAD(P)/FAD-dependent oxidoreductase n=1 Tax=Rhodococcus sp. IEGM 1379 TaxID=3047086 RepID=UPI0024B742A4|nr:NAD(P)/FAD-dependent oxidoreductase [Rhodococcus sp. IEGM 1379]MDI9918878.1 NAD(P)/FAD-dependent oxidoreductase [Rhodococcus sp. IEGM 1379]